MRTLKINYFFYLVQTDKFDKQGEL
jgi:hypothetical protein